MKVQMIPKSSFLNFNFVTDESDTLTLFATPNPPPPPIKIHKMQNYDGLLFFYKIGLVVIEINLKLSIIRKH